MHRTQKEDGKLKIGKFTSPPIYLTKPRRRNITARELENETGRRVKNSSARASISSCPPSAGAPRRVFPQASSSCPHRITPAAGETFIVADARQIWRRRINLGSIAAPLPPTPYPRDRNIGRRRKMPPDIPHFPNFRPGLSYILSRFFPARACAALAVTGVLFGQARAAGRTCGLD